MSKISWFFALIGVFAALGGTECWGDSSEVVYDCVFRPVGFSKGRKPVEAAAVNFGQTLPGLSTSMAIQGQLQGQSAATNVTAKRKVTSRINGWSNGFFNVPVKVELPEEAVSVLGGEITYAVAERGAELLPQDRKGRTITFPKLAENNKTVEFIVKLPVPRRMPRSVRELSGTLEYMTAKSSKENDLGVMEFRKGATGKEPGIAVQSVKIDELDDRRMVVELKVPLRRGMIKSAKFLGGDGKNLEVSGPDWKTSDSGENTVCFSVKRPLPLKGQIVLDVFEQPEKKVHNFTEKDIPLSEQDVRKPRSNLFEDESPRDLLTGSSRSRSGRSRRSRTRRTAGARGEEAPVEEMVPEEDLYVPPEPDYSTPVATQLIEASKKRQEKDMEAAIRMYESVTVNDEASDKQVVRAYYRLGMCYASMGDKERAAEQYEQIVSEFSFLPKEVARANRALKKVRPRENERSRRNRRGANSRYSRGDRYGRGERDARRSSRGRSRYDSRRSSRTSSRSYRDREYETEEDIRTKERVRNERYE